MHHREQDQQSYQLHVEAVKLMRADPALIDRAIGILQQWGQLAHPCSKPLRDAWLRILNNHDWDAALAEDDFGMQIRQASPLACILPNARRLEIIRSCKKQRLNNAENWGENHGVMRSSNPFELRRVDLYEYSGCPGIDPGLFFVASCWSRWPACKE